MNIIEAVKAAQNSKKVKRKEWVISLYAAVDTFWVFNGNKTYTLTLSDILADDWEVVE